ncbi:peptidase [Frondihabitans sp. PAMC 28766]|uniref:Type 1 glutamine amidotransferase-like domain-containing protein n=1 Tax=Frondihabitans sp. PAMC 28766 TaxID=1795630 RepID=UPI00078CCF9C|nr:peptidase E [Frondihabitans sp. PAMC 28766]AMM21589.1 peptidase [Frondihabitans sp. PAMC 28766]
MTTPRILATSGGIRPGKWTYWAPAPLMLEAIALSAHPGAARLAYLGTAMGDRPDDGFNITQAFAGTSTEVSVVSVMPHPNVADLREHLLAQDVIWVGGGSVAGLLALWRLHGLDVILREAWEAGVVLAGVSAGSICWHVGGPTDSFGPELRGIDNALALLPYGNGVHYDAEEQRRPLLHSLVGDGTLPLSYATDNGVGLLYEGTEFVEALSEREGAGAYRVERTADGSVVETRIEPRVLPGA